MSLAPGCSTSRSGGDVGTSRRRADKLSNGRIFLSQRDAAKQLGTHHTQIARWFRELQHFGFLVMTKGGSLGVDGKGKAPHWRLTELATIAARQRVILNGGRVRNLSTKKTKSRAGKSAHPVPGSQHSGVPESRPLESESVPGSQHIGDQRVCREVST